jgi:hypothetical protein
MTPSTDGQFLWTNQRPGVEIYDITISLLSQSDDEIDHRSVQAITVAAQVAILIPDVPPHWEFGVTCSLPAYLVDDVHYEFRVERAVHNGMQDSAGRTL